MSRMSRLSVVLMALIFASAGMVGASTPFSECTEDRQHVESEAIYRICTPPEFWVNNRELVIWAHGYVDEFQPIEIPNDQVCLTDTLCVNDLINFLGFNFATTSYSANGLAVLPGLEDVIELIDLYTAEVGEAPLRTYVVGASEGGLIAALAIENHPELFDGGLATCGPIGDFKRQTRYFGDFRVIFDYFFPGLMPGTPTEIPMDVIDNWDEIYADDIFPVVTDRANRNLLEQLFDVTRAPFTLDDRQFSVELTLSDLLWYNVFATNNAVDVLGGQPYDNIGATYYGSDDDDALNASVQRIAADPAAVTEMEANYNTSGVLTNPLVTLHTTLDQQVPIQHEDDYLEKTMESGAYPDRHFNYPPSEVYGHCLFPINDVVGAFTQLVEMVTGTAIAPEQIEALRQQLAPGELWDRPLPWAR